MRQTLAAAAATPHGGHVIVKEWTVICDRNILKVIALAVQCSISCGTLLPKTRGTISVMYLRYHTGNRVPLTSAAIALAVKLIDG